MKSLLVLPLLAGFLLAPSPAAAHTCDLDDAVCVAECMRHSLTGGDACSVRRMDPPSFAPCPSGSGVVATVGSRTVPACVTPPTATLGPCGEGEVGVIAYVDGRAVPVCASLA